jgi:hypothetical protein
MDSEGNKQIKKLVEKLNGQRIIKSGIKLYIINGKNKGRITLHEVKNIDYILGI